MPNPKSLARNILAVGLALEIMTEAIALGAVFGEGNSAARCYNDYQYFQELGNTELAKYNAEQAKIHANRSENVRKLAAKYLPGHRVLNLALGTQF